jgi:5-methylcytosine-specific restriction endonuclease McrA
MRSTKEWIGRSDDSRPPDHVRLRVFAAHNGICHISKRAITAADTWDLEHILAICNGGENRESNLAPALIKPHRAKTARDLAQKAKNDRVRKRHLGIKKRSTFACSRDSRFKKKINGEVVLR